MSLDKNIIRNRDGLNINIGNHRDFEITQGDVCHNPDVLIQITDNPDCPQVHVHDAHCGHNEGRCPHPTPAQDCCEQLLVVNTAAKFNCDTEFDGDVAFNDSVDVNGEINLHNTVNIDETVNIGGNINVGGTANIGGDTNIGGNVTIGGDTIFNGDVSVGPDNEIEDPNDLVTVEWVEEYCAANQCAGGGKVIVLFNVGEVRTNQTLDVNGDITFANIPYVASKKIKVKKVKLIIGSSTIRSNDFININLYSIKLNGVSGYSSHLNPSNLNPSDYQLITTIGVDGSTLSVGEYDNRKYRYVDADVNVETVFEPAALVAQVKMSDIPVSDVYLWVIYEDID